MSNTRNDMLTVIEMKHDWIRRKEIAEVLDTPGLLWTPLYTKYVYSLERVGLIESRKVGRFWEYKAVDSD